MTRRNTPLEVEQVEQLALIARLLPHHGESPSLISSNDGITVRQFSRALFQQHRSESVIQCRVVHVREFSESGSPASAWPGREGANRLHDGWNVDPQSFCWAGRART